MRILYAVQATGNGHISRAIQLLPYLQQWGAVDVFLSGANATLQAPLPVVYRSRGLSLFYNRAGGLHYTRMLRENSLLRIWKEARQLPLHKYDVVINDFEAITALACRWQKKVSVQFGHQASFASPLTPRPQQADRLGEWLLQHYAPATHYVGLHFRPYDQFIFPPVIKDTLLQAGPTNTGHITVYLAAYHSTVLAPILRQLPQVHFHLFMPHTRHVERQGNITFFPISQQHFNDSLLSCEGIITGAGFETPAEALYLQKRLLCVPIRGQYEQWCNLAALQQLGVRGVARADTPRFAAEVEAWLQAPKPVVAQAANDIPHTLQFLFHKAMPHRYAAP
jgi:uncharacterized protein (TIGR00661 family)